MSQNIVKVTRNKTRVITVGIQGPQGPQGIQGEDGAPGGATELSDLSDFSVDSNLADGDILSYNASSQTWTNQAKEEIVDGGNF